MRIEPATALSFSLRKICKFYYGETVSSVGRAPHFRGGHRFDSDTDFLLFFSRKEERENDMNIEQFELIICDMYQMDVWMPNPVFDKQEFINTSYSQWAICEFRNYLVQRLYPQSEGTIDEFVEMAEEFINKMNYFSELNSANKKLFSIAQDTITDIQDMLRAMQ